MENMNYKKILDRLINEHPHEIDKIIKVYKDSLANSENKNIFTFEEILSNKVWSKDEKIKLLKALKYRDRLEDLKDNNTSTELYLLTLKCNNISGFEALLEFAKNKKLKDKINKSLMFYNRIVAFYQLLIKNIINSLSDSDISLFVKAIIENIEYYENELLFKSLFMPNYKGITPKEEHNENIMTAIIMSKDISLIDKYIDNVDNIKIYYGVAINTRDINVVDYFIKKGMNVNDILYKGLTPLKSAIRNNDLQMVLFLISKGAKVDLDSVFEKVSNEQELLEDSENDLMTSSQIIARKNPDNIKEKIFVKTSSPLEYSVGLQEKAITFLENRDTWSINFIDRPLNYNKLSTSSNLEERKKIIEYLFDKTKDKSSNIITEIIILAFATQDIKMISKYINYAIDNKIKISYNRLIKYFIVCKAYNFSNYQEFLNLLNNVEPIEKENLYIRLLEFYIKYNFKINNESFIMTPFLKEVITNISQSKRTKVELVPFCGNLNTLNELVSLGFDIKQKDSNNRNIIFNIFIRMLAGKKITNEELELLNYLIDKVDLNEKDVFGKTIIYYALQVFGYDDKSLSTEQDENYNLNSRVEETIIMLLKKMPNNIIKNNDNKEVIEGRINGKYGNYLDGLKIYRLHSELFTLLREKGLLLSKETLNKLVDNILYEKELNHSKNSKDFENALKFIFEKLDYDREIQVRQNIVFNGFSELYFYTKRKDIKFEEYLELYKKYIENLSELVKFKKMHINKKFSPERYISLASIFYGIDYNSIDKYILKVIILGINKFGSDKLPQFLDLVPDFNINTYLLGDLLDINYDAYYERVQNLKSDEQHTNSLEDNYYFLADNVIPYSNQILFYGGLMQYAILIDDLEMVKYLQKKGAKLAFNIDINEIKNSSITAGNHTWDYVNSTRMLNYIQAILGPKSTLSFDDKEATYYNNLLKLKLVLPENKDN